MHYLSEMGVAKLQLFVRFCNVVGLFPFRMVLDNETKEFKRFDSHWRHPSNWWFTLLFVGFILFLLAFNYVQYKKMSQDVIPFLTKVEIVAIFLYFININILNSIPRLFLLHFRHLKTAFECLHRIDRVLNRMSHAPCTTRQRTLFGVSNCFGGVFIWFTVNIQKCHVFNSCTSLLKDDRSMDHIVLLGWIINEWNPYDNCCSISPFIYQFCYIAS